jgi:predicted RNA-binding protein with PUA-like domain
MRYWLMKTEPDVFSIDDLERDGVTPWEGVRSYQARNLLRDQVRVGDAVLFYHSSTQPPGVAGLAEVVRESYPDRTAFDPGSPYHDPRSTQDEPRWFVVDVRFVERFPGVVPLAVLQATPGLEDMMVTKRGMRLSVQPVTEDEWRIVVALGRAAQPAPPAEAPAPRTQAARATRKTKATKAKATKTKTRASKTKATKAKATKPRASKPKATKTKASKKTRTKASRAPASKAKAARARG